MFSWVEIWLLTQFIVETESCLEKLIDLDANVPALQETGAGILVRKLRDREGRVGRLSARLVSIWKEKVLEYAAERKRKTSDDAVQDSQKDEDLMVENGDVSGDFDEGAVAYYSDVAHDNEDNCSEIAKLQLQDSAIWKSENEPFPIEPSPGESFFETVVHPQMTRKKTASDCDTGKIVKKRLDFENEGDENKFEKSFSRQDSVSISLISGLFISSMTLFMASIKDRCESAWESFSGDETGSSRSIFLLLLLARFSPGDFSWLMVLRKFLSFSAKPKASSLSESNMSGESHLETI